MFNFEKLETWKRAIEFAGLIYRSTKSFPADERFGLTNQMRRAAVSVSSNLAEGSSRSSKIDYARFVEIATGSLFEVVSQSCIAQQQGFPQRIGFPSHPPRGRRTRSNAERPSQLPPPRRRRSLSLSTINSQLSTRRAQ
jgi:four helix bundle protein